MCLLSHMNWTFKCDSGWPQSLYHTTNVPYLSSSARRPHWNKWAKPDTLPEIWDHWADNNFKNPTAISEATQFKDNKHKALPKVLVSCIVPIFTASFKELKKLRSCFRALYVSLTATSSFCRQFDCNGEQNFRILKMLNNEGSYSLRLHETGRL